MIKALKGVTLLLVFLLSSAPAFSIDYSRIGDYQPDKTLIQFETLKPLGPVTAKFRDAGTYYLG
ncbi:MAG: hypothetical protein Q4D87_07870, partial [Actinomycetaceae bacterium]|nr:hypothetical protein [Actinomycetaceae bacterium]